MKASIDNIGALHGEAMMVWGTQVRTEAGRGGGEAEKEHGGNGGTMVVWGTQVRADRPEVRCWAGLCGGMGGMCGGMGGMCGGKGGMCGGMGGMCEGMGGMCGGKRG